MNTPPVICLVCRKSGAALPCPHRKITGRDVRVPRLAAGRRQWTAFVDWLNERAIPAGLIRWHDTGQVVRGRVSLDG